jgi:hypothetical protein
MLGRLPDLAPDTHEEITIEAEEIRGPEAGEVGGPGRDLARRDLARRDLAPPVESMLSLGSTPVTDPPGPTSLLISRARKPGPDPMSSTSSPGFRPSAARTVRRCPATSGVL